MRAIDIPMFLRPPSICRIFHFLAFLSFPHGIVTISHQENRRVQNAPRLGSLKVGLLGARNFDLTGQIDSASASVRIVRKWMFANGQVGRRSRWRARTMRTSTTSAIRIFSMRIERYRPDAENRPERPRQTMPSGTTRCTPVVIRTTCVIGATPSDMPHLTRTRTASRGTMGRRRPSIDSFLHNRPSVVPFGNRFAFGPKSRFLSRIRCHRRRRKRIAWSRGGRWGVGRDKD